MCLTIYTNKADIPNNIDFIDYNDLFFEGVRLEDSDITSKILMEIDKAKYNSPLTFIGRDESIGALSKSNLSTGSKTLLNIISNTDKCFSLAECGQNALCLLPYITNGIVLWEVPVLHYSEKYTNCDIRIDNKQFNNFKKFLSYVMD